MGAVVGETATRGMDFPRSVIFFAYHYSFAIIKGGSEKRTEP